MKRKNAKTIKYPNFVAIKSVIIICPKTLHKLSKVVRQAEKVSQVKGADKNSDSPLYSETKKWKCLV